MEASLVKLMSPVQSENIHCFTGSNFTHNSQLTAHDPNLKYRFTELLYPLSWEKEGYEIVQIM